MDFIEEYLKKGFGSMNKNDIEVLVFHLLLQEEKKEQRIGLKGMTDFAISVALQIPESKVKRLRYEAELKYPNDDKKKALLDLLSTAQYKKENGKIIFVVTNKMLRLYIADLLFQGNNFFDTSFNSNIVSLYIEDFIILLKKVYNENDIDQIVKYAKEKIKEQMNELPPSGFDLFGLMVQTAAESIVEKVAGDFTLQGIKNVVKSVDLCNKYKAIKEKNS